MTWIKFEGSTSDKPEVWEMAQLLGIDPDAVVGKLLRVWVWFDAHTETGNAPSVTKAILDCYVRVTGFTETMIKVGWMAEAEGVISLPNFDRHNGDTAKKRATTAKRVAKSRAGNASVAHQPLQKRYSSSEDVTQEPLAREEKKREDQIREEKEKEKRTKEQEKEPSSARCEKFARAEYSEGFQRFWDAYPTKRRLGKKQAYAAWQKAIRTADAESIIGKAAEYAASDRGQGEYSCMPATWLNQGRWEDDPAAWQDDRAQAAERKPSQPKTFAQIREENTKNAFKRFEESGQFEAIFNAVRGITPSPPSGSDGCNDSGLLLGDGGS